MTPTSARGAALVDVLCAVAIVGILASMSVPNMAGSLERERALVGAQMLAGYAQRARFEALRRGTAVAVQFEVSAGRTAIRMFADGNGNGVLQRDIDVKVDPAIGGVEWLDQHARGVSLRINQPVPEIGGGAPLKAGDDPLRIGRTSLVVFSPLGSSTSGTLYVAAAEGPQMALRLFGATGRARLLTFNRAGARWEY